MAVIVPTITTEDLDDYNQKVKLLSSFTKRIHFDASDDIFAPRKLLPATNFHWPDGVVADIHAMIQRPLDELHTLISLKPSLLIFHQEAENVHEAFLQLDGTGIKRGVALLAETSVETIKPLLELVEHVLVFSGNLGYQGGSTVDFGLLTKVQQLKTWKPELEIGWDGGVNADNARRLAEGGVDVLNVGGFISQSIDPKAAFQQLQSAL